MADIEDRKTQSDVEAKAAPDTAAGPAQDTVVDPAAEEWDSLPLDIRRARFLPIFLANITEQQRKDYEQAAEHFGPLYRIEDTNYFYQKFREYQKNQKAQKNKK